jgi:hypothetical protein
MKRSVFTCVALVLGTARFAVACPQQSASAACDVAQLAAPVVAVQSIAVPSVAVLATPSVVTPAAVLATPTFVTPTLVTPNVIVNEVVRHQTRSRARVHVTRIRVR